jgi:DNA primase
MVASISKISDQIKKEIYIKECSSIMDISEEVLYSTLAQISKKQSSKLTNLHQDQKNLLRSLKIKMKKRVSTFYMN